MAPEINVRPWNRRRDRSAIERWPAAELPAHWVETPDTGRRESWAIDLGSELVGRITLRSIQGVGYARLGIYLHPERYGQGIGTAALRQFARIAPVDAIWLDVAPDNERAIRCYLSSGFKRQGFSSSGNVEMALLTEQGRNHLLGILNASA